MLDGNSEIRLPRDQHLHEKVYQQLRRLIVDGRLQPGERLIETTLSARLGVSRTPLREAIRRLAQEGWLTLQPNGGATVRLMLAQDLIDAYATRAVLEGLASRFACDRAAPEELRQLRQLTEAERTALRAEDMAEFARLNREFHSGIGRLAHNLPLQDALERLQIHTLYYQRAILEAAKSPAWRQSYVQFAGGRIDSHARLLDLIEERRFDEAEQLARTHALGNAENLVSLLRLDGTLSPVLSGQTTAAGVPPDGNVALGRWDW